MSTTFAKKSKAHITPYFAVRATVSIFLCQDNASNNPDARIRVNFLISHQEQVYRYGRDSAEIVLRRFGTDQKMLDAAYYEVEVDAYHACDARYVRNPDLKPVEAFFDYDKKDEARLIRQRRLVPESYQDINRIYGPKPHATVNGAAA